MTIGERIRSIRKQKGLTQKKLGEMCGINEANIRKYELGRQNPKISTLKKISDALNVNMTELFLGTSTKAQEKEVEETENIFALNSYALENEKILDFLESIGYRTIIDSAKTKNATNEEELLASKAWIIWDTIDGEYYFLSTYDLKYFTNSILKYTYFQINELMKTTNKIEDKEEIDKYRKLFIFQKYEKF